MIKKLKILLAFITLNFFTTACAQTSDANIRSGVVEDCGPKPNCVSTKATNSDRQIQVINFTGSLEDFKKYSLSAIKQMPRFKIVHDSTRYSSQDEFRGQKFFRYLLQDRVFIYIEQQDIENNSNELVGRLVVAELGARKKERKKFLLSIAVTDSLKAVSYETDYWYCRIFLISRRHPRLLSSFFRARL
ncbi:MAG: hypothetical protein ABL930_13835 [Pseudobdellovibrio sp.]